jgi:hypothetical protein
MVPDKPTEGREIAVTTVEEQTRPLQTVGEHLLATLAQIHEGESDWMLVDEIKAHRPASSVAVEKEGNEAHKSSRKSQWKSIALIGGTATGAGRSRQVRYGSSSSSSSLAVSSATRGGGWAGNFTREAAAAPSYLSWVNTREEEERKLQEGATWSRLRGLGSVTEAVTAPAAVASNGEILLPVTLILSIRP